MQPDTTVSTITVRFSDGGTFVTRAESASEYLLDPCFVRFLFICVMLYGILMTREDLAQLEPLNQVMLWITMFVVTAGWLVFSAGLNLYLVRRKFVKTIFTPAIIFPLVPVNITAAASVSSLLGAEYWMTFPDNVGSIAQNLLAVVCYDILHGRYVAPTHPTVIGAASSSATTAGTHNPAMATTAAPYSTLSITPSGTLVPQATVQPAAAPKPAAPVRPREMIEIAGERFEADDIQYIKSEDHYLKVQMADKSALVRGKLKEVVKMLPPQSGIQISRSVWVAFESIDSKDEPTAGNLQITMKDESVFKVTSSRRLAFLQSYEIFGAAKE